MEAMWSRFLPSYVELGRLLDEQAIGRPLLLTADFSFAVDEDARAGHRLFDPARGGGALLDLGVYPLQLSRLVFGEPDDVFATGLLTDSGVDGQTTLTLTHAGGGVSLLSDQHHHARHVHRPHHGHRRLDHAGRVHARHAAAHASRGPTRR